MSNGFVQRDGVLKKAAADLDTCTNDVRALCAKLDSQIQGQAGWGGQGRAALDQVNIAWQEKQKIVLGALEYLGQAIGETDKETQALDSDVASFNQQYANKLA